MCIRDRVSGLRRFYQIDENDIDSYFFRKAASPMSVDEVLVVKANSSSEASAYLEAAQAHLESQKNIFEGYGTDPVSYTHLDVYKRQIIQRINILCQVLSNFLSRQ